MKYEVIIKREVHTTTSLIVEADTGVDAIVRVLDTLEYDIPKDSWVTVGGGQSFSVLPAEGERDERGAGG